MCTSAKVTDSQHGSEWLIGVVVLVLAFLPGCAATNGPARDSGVSNQPAGVVEERYQDGLAAMATGDHERAERQFLKIVADFPLLAGPYCNLAIIYSKQGKYEDALAYVDKALAMDGGLVEGYNVRGGIRLKQGHVKDAERDYLKAVELRPGYANAQYNLALLYDVYYQDIAKAISHYEIYLSLLEKPDEATKEWVRRLRGTLKNG